MLNNFFLKARAERKDTIFDIHSLEWLNENREDENIDSNNHFEIIWITKGNGNHWIDLQKMKIENNQLFFIKPGQVNRLKHHGELEGYVISFTESFLGIEEQEADSTYHSSLFKMFATAKGILLTDDVVANMKDIIMRMLKEFNSSNLFRLEILRRYFKIFLIYLSRQFEGSFETTPQTRNMELLQKFMSLLEKKFKTQKMVAEYASELYVTPNYLNEIIKKTTGYSAGHHIRQRIVLEAKRQATYSGNCMKEIAYYLGFCDMAHFSKFFKNTTGMNFTDFKKEKFVISMTASLAS